MEIYKIILINQSKEYYDKHKEEIKEKNLRYYYENRDKILAKKNLQKEKIKEYNKRYYLQNKEYLNHIHIIYNKYHYNVIKQENNKKEIQVHPYFIPIKEPKTFPKNLDKIELKFF